MKSDLVKLEQDALKLMNSGKKAEAAELFSAIIKEQPSWEHGEAFYNLAVCYEDLGELHKAAENYLQALKYEPRNPYFLGGYASYLYLHGEPNAAFEAYLRLWRFEGNEQESADKTLLVLRELSKRLKISDQELEIRLKH